MFKIGKVYKYSSNLWYIADKRMKGGSYLYKVRRVSAMGNLGIEREIRFKKNYKIAEGVKVNIIIEVPRKNREMMLYNSLLATSRKYVKAYLNAKTPYMKKKNKELIARNAIASVGFYLVKEGRDSNLRDYARRVGFVKNPSKLYALVHTLMKGLCPAHKYKITLKDAADTSIVSAVRQYQNNWNLLHGFSKKLDIVLERDLKGYMAELRNRGLRV